jgi:hypothetical protein
MSDVARNPNCRNNQNLPHFCSGTRIRRRLFPTNHETESPDVTHTSACQPNRRDCCFRQGLRGLCPSPRSSQAWRFLDHTRQGDPGLQSYRRIAGCGRQQFTRPTHQAFQRRGDHGLTRGAGRAGNGLPDWQSGLEPKQYRQPLPLSLIHRSFLQVDQTNPPTG